MILIQTILLLFSTHSFAKNLDLSKLGQRPAYCKQNEDSKVLTISDEFVSESQEKFDADKLTLGLMAGDHCFRVGTEIFLQLASGEIQYLGKALITNISITTSKDLSLNKSLQDFNKSSLEKFITNNKGKSISLIHFKVMEKVTETVLENKYDRLQTCFVSYADWESYPLNKDTWESELESLKTGTKKADIWNGTNNCYKIGIKADIRAPGQKEKLGKIVPTKVFLTHYSKVTEEQAKILGEDLKDLKNRLEKNKDTSGGYTTMVVFDYLAPETKSSSNQ